MSYIFISHVHEDSAIAVAIASGIEAAGYAAWYYERDTDAGLTYLDQILDAIGDSTAVIVLISRDALGSQQVDREIVQAYESGKPLLPLLLDMPYEVFRNRRRDWAMMIGAAVALPIDRQDVSAALPRIVRGLKALEAQHEARGAPEERATGDVPSPGAEPSASPDGAVAGAARPRGAPLVARSHGRRAAFAGAILAVAILIVAGALIAARQFGHSSKVVINDPLSQAKGGTLSTVSPEPGHVRVGYAGGAYFIDQVDPKWGREAVVYVPGLYDNVSMAVDARLVGATAGRYIILGCRIAQDFISQYALYVGPGDGTVELMRWDNNTSVDLKGLQSPVVHQGNARNRVELSCVGSTITARVNGVAVISVHDTHYTAGQLELGVVGTVGVPSTIEGRFTHLLVTRR